MPDRKLSADAPELRFDRRAADSAYAPKVVVDRQQSITNISGTITAGGTAQPLAAADPGRSGLLVQNASGGDLWVLEGGLGTAAAAQPAIRIRAGEYWLADVVVPDAYSIFGATTGQAFSGRSW